RVTELVVDGRPEPVELLVIGIGAEPNVELAREAGLACDNGIVVDERMRTEDPAILAIGDCTSFPRNGARMRLESVQNANDQARTAAATAMGRDEPYGATPWLWTEQGSMRLQIAGLLPPDRPGARRPGRAPRPGSGRSRAACGCRSPASCRPPARASGARASRRSISRYCTSPTMAGCSRWSRSTPRATT